MRDAEGRIQFHYVLVDFLCRVTGGELRAGEDADEARWLSADELDEFPIADFAAEVLRKGLKKIE